MVVRSTGCRRLLLFLLPCMGDFRIRFYSATSSLGSDSDLGHLSVDGIDLDFESEKDGDGVDGREEGEEEGPRREKGDRSSRSRSYSHSHCPSRALIVTSLSSPSTSSAAAVPSTFSGEDRACTYRIFHSPQSPRHPFVRISGFKGRVAVCPYIRLIYLRDILYLLKPYLALT